MTTAYTCSRCGGSGRYSFNLIHGTKCYGCGGTGKQKTKPRPPTPKWAVFGTHRATGTLLRLYNVTAKSEREAIAKAVKAFDRAKVIKGILWPAPEPLFHIIKQGAYFRPNYSGYTNDQVDADKYTKAELKPYADQIARGDLRAVPV